MALATEPLAPQKDLTSQELASGYGYGPLVSYVNGICNPAGRRSGTQRTVTDAASMVTALAAASYGDDIVIAAGTTVTSGVTTGAFTFPTLGAPTATTPRQAPARMTTYVSQNSVSSTGVLLGGPTPTSPSKMASVTTMSTPSRMASVILQGEPSYVRIMSSEAHLITNPPPHDHWHVSNYSHFAHLDQGSSIIGVLQTPDLLRNYAGYNYFRMEGLRLINGVTNGTGYFVAIGPPNGGVTNNGPFLAPHHFIFDRCYLDGDRSGAGVVPAGDGSNRGVSGGCDFFGFLNGRVSGIYRPAAGDYNLEANSFAFSFGIGPVHVENSWLNGAGECTLFNGGIVSGQFPYPYIVADCTFLKNWCLRPLSWRESFHYNAIPPNQTGECTFSIDAGGTVVTAAFGGIGGRLMHFDADEYLPGDYFWTSTSGRPVRVQSINSQLQMTLGSVYTENAGGSGLTGVITRGRQMLDGMDAKQVTLSGSGNRTVTGTGTSWLTTLKPYVDSPPPGSGVFFGINTNLVTGTGNTANNQKKFPVLKRILSVESDTQLTLAEDYTAGTFTNKYYSVTFWDGKVRSVMKNLHEWKAANRVRTVGNVFENAWSTFNGQGENAIAINSGNGNMGYQRDLYFGYNLVVNAGLLVYCVGYPWTNGPPPGNPELAATEHVCIEHMLATDVYNYKWQADYSANSQTFLPYALNPGGFTSEGTHSFQFRHSAAILSTDYTSYFLLLNPSVQGLPETEHEQMVIRDNIAHVGSHSSLINTISAGFTPCGNNSPSHADTDDADALWAGTGFSMSGLPRVTPDSIAGHNIFLRGSAPAIAAHTVNYGGGNAGLADETGAGFTNFGNSANIPRWLTQSVSPADYALTPLYTTSPGVCTVSGATVTISVGSFPAAVAAGTPFLVQGDSYLYLTRVLTRDSGGQLTLTTSYPGTTGAGLTGILGFKGAASEGTTQTIYTTNASAVTVTNISSDSYSETWTHANAGSLTADQTWTQTLGSNWGIVSNKATLTAAAGSNDQVAICQKGLAGADHKASVTLDTYTLVSNAQGGLVISSDAAGQNYYMFRAVGGTYQMYRVAGGTSFTQIGSSGVAAASGQVLEFERTGTGTGNLIARVNGTPIITVTDTTWSGLYQGVWGFRGSAGDNIILDGFSAQTTTTLDIARVTLSSGSFPTVVTPTALFPRTFLVSGDSATLAKSVQSRDSSTQITLSGQYGGTTGSGLTGVISGTVPSGVDPGPDTTVLALVTGGIRT